MLTDDQIKVLEELSKSESPVMASSSEDTIIINRDDTIIDLGNYGAASETYNITDMSSGSIDLSGISTISLPNTTYVGSGATVGGIYTGTSPTYTINTGSYNWGSVGINEPTVEINTDGVNIKDNGDIKIGDVSLKDFIKTMQERLAILVPDPAKLEKFEALKKAYEHYKLMEKLCQEEPKEED